ncbi:MAG: hypothetical protein EON88_31560, partial [Brevundimonas sp.]
ANAAYAAAKALGIKVPEELNIIAVCNAGDPRHPDTPISAIMIDPGEVGRAAGAAMLDWLNGVPPAHDHKVEIAHWIWRATTGPLDA